MRYELSGRQQTHLGCTSQQRLQDLGDWLDASFRTRHLVRISWFHLNAGFNLPERCEGRFGLSQTPSDQRVFFILFRPLHFGRQSNDSMQSFDMFCEAAGSGTGSRTSFIRTFVGLGLGVSADMCPQSVLLTKGLGTTRTAETSQVTLHVTGQFRLQIE